MIASHFGRSAPSLVVAAAFLASPARADDVPVGTVRTLPVVSVSLDVGSTEKDAKRVVYAPPPGWYIRSHRVGCGQKTGHASFTVSTVPAGWQWESAEQYAASGQTKAAGTVTAYKVTASGSGELATTGAAAGKQTSSSSHHVLVVDVSAKGAGLWQGGASIELTVVADLVYVGKK